ncbi:MAG: LPXTG cell wall anchor domain-containing protein [Actinocatenispora sp.]
MRVIRRLAVAAGAATAGLALALPAAGYADAGTSGNVGVGNGSQVQAPVQGPANVCGNGLGAVGAGRGTCVDGHATAENPGCPDGSEPGTDKYCPQSESPSPSESPAEPSASPVTSHPVAPVTPVSDNRPTLPVTGSSLTILVTAALVLLAGGVGFLFFARRRRA